MKLKIIKFSDELIMPTRGHYDDAGLDCYALDNYTLEPLEMTLIPLGLGIELPNGYMATIRPRSSMNFKNVLTQIGTVDSGYRGEIKCILVNLNKEPMTILKGSKICQIIIEPVIIADLVEYLGETRDSNGFGSTDKKPFNVRLKELMILNHLTQKELAQKSRISEASISRYINGKRLPNVVDLYELAKALKVRPQELL